MLRRSADLSINVSRISLNKHFVLQQLRSKTGRRFNHRCNDADGDEDKFRKRNENRNGYIQFYKSRGQHILTNARVLDSIVRNSDIKPTDTVLEIGPGTGNLTLKLLEVAKKVTAVEIDKRMVEVLNKRVVERGLEERLTVICKDALKTEFPKFDLVVANIPYGISSPLVAKLIFGENLFRSATILLQKEFARRLLAKPGDSDFNRLAVNVKLVAEVEFVMDVSKRDFVPCPKVDSSVVKIRPKAQIPDVDLQEWCSFTRTCFCKKNKTLGATFKQKKKVIELFKTSELKTGYAEGASRYCNHEYNDGDEEDVDMTGEGDWCSSTGFDARMSLFREKLIEILRCNGFEEKRPSKLSNEELLHLLSLFNQVGIHFHDQAKLSDEGDTAFTAAFSSS